MAYEVEIPEEQEKEEKLSLSIETIGEFGYRFLGQAEDVAVLVVDIIYFGARDILDRHHYRKGTFVEQAYYMGATALPIVGTILFLIGAILALQSAAQLRQFGAAIFVVDLLAIGLATEFAPLLTAILLAGRTGSAIASEIATMKFTEEIDAIKTLGLNPIRFVVVPKLWAMIICMPLLSVMALLIGLLGGFVVAILYIGLSPTAFINELLRALKFQDIFNGLLKTISFAVIIVIVGTWNGLNFTGGADGVGRATTNSVVAAIFGIIVADAIWSIIFYFRF
jgi:phospholipid/cholesterol/gamma-HCH transport system permease protein